MTEMTMERDNKGKRKVGLIVGGIVLLNFIVAILILSSRL